jgi:pimeloyl-ACP methyl ester carboxylesterase
MLQVASSDGVTVAVHHLAGASTSPPLLFSHATGFHARCYAPIAQRLADRFDVFGLDYRGHGATPAPPDWTVDWSRFGDDALCVTRALAPDGGLVAFGHSMGGSALLMAAHREPTLFDRLVLFEPIAHQPGRSHLSDVDMRALPIVTGALRRRRTFASRDDAAANFAAKPPLSLMVPAALRAYVEHGFRDVTGADGEPAVELCCSPELEAGIFLLGRDNDVWPLLHEIRTPCLVIGGRVEEMQPSAATEAIANELPGGRYVRLDHQSHFGPFSHPEEIADLVVRGAP